LGGRFDLRLCVEYQWQEGPASTLMVETTEICCSQYLPVGWLIGAARIVDAFMTSDQVLLKTAQ